MADENSALWFHFIGHSFQSPAYLTANAMHKQISWASTQCKIQYITSVFNISDSIYMQMYLNGQKQQCHKLFAPLKSMI